MVENWVKEMMEDFDASIGHEPLQVGGKYKLTNGESSRVVLITDGQYWGKYGLSNFWYWKEIRPDGSLGKEEHGYDNQSVGIFQKIG